MAGTRYSLQEVHCCLPTKVLLRTTKYYSVLQSTTHAIPCYKVVRSTAPYYKVLLRATKYYTPLLFHTEKYFFVLQGRILHAAK